MYRSAESTATLTQMDAPNGTLRLRGDSPMSELRCNGYAVVHGAIPPDRAARYVNEIYRWLESVGKGFKADDRDTWHVQCMPRFQKGGLYKRYGVAHEQFAWDIRTEPAVIDAFAQIWGTDELLVSFDAINASFPFPSDELGQAAKPWPHVDQSPTRSSMHCIQGIINLLENGPDDGGLMVLEGSMSLFAEFFRAHPQLRPEEGWPEIDWYSHSDDTLQWFYERGCKWKKIEAGPGDLILWDSRMIHYGDAAKGDRPRVATYVCYKPAKTITSEKLEAKKECFRERWGTSHDPLNFRISRPNAGDYTLEPKESVYPRRGPTLSERALKLAGIVEY
ncbi:hypothetical protein BCR39DRAFT_560206 [Naematelia encephala]|uniref:Phytanoyl-CoA dioxygenase n=1 Tax=Naematelia encephala TaxID=71784 RepID=A0A1Y2AX08_9TREE|nr:hypothetical protein BCR39DRAFT_560206 [Naematelia encephala]